MILLDVESFIDTTDKFINKIIQVCKREKNIG